MSRAPSAQAKRRRKQDPRKAHAAPSGLRNGVMIRWPSRTGGTPTFPGQMQIFDNGGRWHPLNKT